MNEEKITDTARKLVREIKDYSESQVDLWRQIPWLALEADGRTGHSELYSKAYRKGFWTLESSAANGHYLVDVDLETGKLIDEYHASNFIPYVAFEDGIPKPSTITPASDRDVLRLAFNVYELNASRIISELEEEAKKPYLFIFDAEKILWKEQIKEELGLERIYKRPSMFKSSFPLP